MFNHPLAPDILGINPVAAFPELQYDQRCTHHLARLQLKMHHLLTGSHMQSFVPVPLILGIPVSRPPHHDENPFVTGFQIIIGPFATGA